MTAATKSPTLKSSKVPDDGAVSIRVDDLIVGRQINAPIVSKHGVLLLARNTPITVEIKRHLKQRGIDSVEVALDDASVLTIRSTSSTSTPARGISFDTELTRKLDALIDSGLVPDISNGPAVSQFVKNNGKAPYDQQQRQRLQDKHSKNGKLLTSLMTSVLHGQESDISVEGMADGYLDEMYNDIDCTLSSRPSSNKSHDSESPDLVSGSIETSLLSMAIGIEMEYDEQSVRLIGIAGLVHDWGMVKVDQNLINAPRALNDIERLEIMRHPIYSLEMIQHASSLPRIISIIAYQVHERFNATGYPRGRRGVNIHPFARVIQVADIYNALINPRPYRAPYTKYSAMSRLIHMVGERSVDSDVVRALLRVLSLFPIGSYVQLSDGSIAQVIRGRREDYSKPIVLRVNDVDGNPLTSDNLDNIIDLASSELTVVQALPTPGSNEVV
jgi:HD-GYP domain-containing protein (c-di-GMP phosphodiesterase class II)